MLEINDILRAHHIKRWTIVNVVNNQSLAEHTFNVTMIARAFAKALKVPDDNLIKAALEHDLSEIVTGDLPTPTKRRMVELGSAPDDIWPTPTRDLNETERKVLKMADIVDAIHFLEDHGVGKHAESVKDYLNGKAREVLDAMGSDQAETILIVVDQILNGEHRI